MSNKTSIVNDETAADPIVMREGEQKAILINVSGVISSLASPTQTFYQENQQTDKSSTYFTGSMIVSGLTAITTKTTTGLKAGNYVLSVFATIDGEVECVKTIPIIVKRASEL